MTSQQTFRRGDAVIYTDRQGVKLETTVRRVALIPTASGSKVRYYALDGLGVLTADGLEHAPLPVPPARVVRPDEIAPGVTLHMWGGGTVDVHRVAEYLGGMTAFYRRQGVEHTASVAMLASCARGVA